MRNRSFQLLDLKSKVNHSRLFLNIAGMFVLALSLGVGWFVPAYGQAVGGGISGVVHDQSGALIPGASVTIQSVETGAVRSLETDENGRYVAPSIAVGQYQLTATKEGFSPETKKGVDITVGQRTTVDFSLSLAGVQQEVTVSEESLPVNVTVQPSSGLINERQVKELPLNGRSYDGLLTLNPAIVNYTSARSGGVATSFSSPGSMFAVSGRRPQENLFLLNGIEFTGASANNTTPGGASGELLGVDAVREFNVVTDTYGAEYGKRSGGQISVITTSGSNQVHGTIYEFLRNSALDARNFFDRGSIPQFQRNQFGASFGGPIRKDKLLIFGNYEGFRQHLGLSDVTLVPDNAARQGFLPASDGSLTYVGVAAAVAPLLSLWPVQNGPEIGGGIGVSYSNPLQVIREDFGTTRVDYNLSQKGTLFGVYTIDDSDANTPTINPLSSVLERIRQQVASLQEQHVLSPSLLNTARIGFSRAAFFFTGETPVNVPGWVEGKPIGAVVIGGGTAVNAASQVSLAGTSASVNLLAFRTLFTYDDHVYYNKGKHQIEAGMWLQQIRANDNLAQSQYGQATFGSLGTFLQGTVATFAAIPSPTPLGFRSLEAAWFVQDSIKLTPRLELRVGFRAESTNGWNESHGRAANYLFDPNGVIQTNPTVSSSAFTVNRAKFLPEPRLGLAWDPFGKSKTVIRAGFGIYRALLDGIDYRLTQTAPFNAVQAITNVPLANIHVVPGAPLATGSLIAPSGIQPDAHTPTVVSYSFKIEQQIAPDTSLAIGYLGSHGYHQILSVDANEPVPTICPDAPCPSNYPAGTVYYPGLAIRPRVNPNVANSTTWITAGDTSYNALTVDVNRRFRQGFQVRGVYTFSKNLDNGTAMNSSVGTNAPGFVMYPGNLKLDWGLSNTDVRHLGVIHGIYELPFGPGKKFLNSASGLRRKLAEGWSVSAIETLQAGLPFTPQLGFNPTNNGDSRNPIRPSLNPGFTGNVILGTPNRYYDPNAFILPLPGTYGNSGRNVLVGPGFGDLDFSVLKNTSLTENVKLQFRAEFFNILNHANFGTPNTIVFSSNSASPSSTAGVITGTAGTSRQIQFGLKLSF